MLQPDIDHSVRVILPRTPRIDFMRSCYAGLARNRILPMLTKSLRVPASAGSKQPTDPAKNRLLPSGKDENMKAHVSAVPPCFPFRSVSRRRTLIDP